MWMVRVHKQLCFRGSVRYSNARSTRAHRTYCTIAHVWRTYGCDSNENTSREFYFKLSNLQQENKLILTISVNEQNSNRSLLCLTGPSASQLQLKPSNGLRNCHSLSDLRSLRLKHLNRTTCGCYYEDASIYFIVRARRLRSKFSFILISRSLFHLPI